MRLGGVYKIGGQFYRIKGVDHGFVHPEDHGLYRADRVEWDGDHWGYHDDDDWMIDPTTWRVVAREVGWDLRREEV